MSFTPILFGSFVFLSAFNAGAMMTLQIQHYGIYSHVQPSGFAAYIRANNRAAVVPVILPAMLLLVVSLGLLIATPRVMTFNEAVAVLVLNLVHLASTFIWQRRLQGEMATTGYDEAKVRLLVSTNWIRTIAFLTQALLAITVVVRAIGQA